MYDNIGGKIKGLAKVIFIIEMIPSIIAGIAIISTDGDLVAIGLLLMIGGPIFAWISSWFLYGFGEIVDKLCAIESNTRVGVKKSHAQIKVDNERIEMLEELREKGLITEAEYKNAIAKK